MGRIQSYSVHTTTGRPITLRTAEESDAQALIAYQLHADQTSEHRITLPHERDTSIDNQQRWLRDMLKARNSLSVIAVDSDSERIVGFINFRGNERSRLAHTGHIGISIHADLRGHGIGSALIRAVLDWARATPDIEKVCLDVFETNTAARRLYERLGFREEFRREKAIKLAPGRYIDDFQMYQWVKGPQSHETPAAL